MINAEGQPSETRSIPYIDNLYNNLANTASYPTTQLDTQTVLQPYKLTLNYVRTKRRPTISTYVNRIKYIEKHLGMSVYKCVYELNTQGRIHVHLIVLAKPNYYFKRLEKKGWSNDLHPLFTKKDYDGWDEYISKHIKDPAYQERIYLENFYNSGYPFI